MRLVVKSSITRHGNFKRTKSSNKTIWVIFKQCGVAKIIFGIFATTLEHFLSVCINATIINRFSSAWRGLHRPSLTFRCKMQFIFTLETSTADVFLLTSHHQTVKWSMNSSSIQMRMCLKIKESFFLEKLDQRDQRFDMWWEPS